MKFRKITNPRAPWPIEARIGHPDRDDAETVRFDAVFEWITPAEAQALARDEADFHALLRRCFVGFEGLEGDDGEPLPFGEETRDAIIANPWYVRPLYEGLGSFLRGGLVPLPTVSGQAGETVEVAEAAEGN